MMSYNGVRRGTKSAGQSATDDTLQVSPHPHEFELYFDL